MSRKDKKNNAPPAATSGDQGGGRTIKKRWIFAGGFAVVIVVALITAFLVGEDPKDTDDTAQTPAETTGAGPGESTTDDEGPTEEWPGAAFDNTQRHWPRNTLDFDDSSWGNPGSYATDRVGRPLWIPEEHDGDLPDASNRKDDPGKCTDVELEGKTQQQYTNGRFMAVNESAGPFKTDGGVPWTYAHSPQGAVMAAMNAYSWINLSNRDQMGMWGAEMKWESPMRDEVIRNSADNTADITTAESPASFRIKSCSNDVVVVQVAPAMQDDSMPSDVWEMPMIWKDVHRREGEGKDWQVVMSKAAEDNSILRQQDTSEYTAVSYQ